MKHPILILLWALLPAACGSNAARSTKPAAQPAAEPVEYTYRVAATYPHLRTSYTQGLQFADGQLWEGTGQYGQSVLQRMELETGHAKIVARLPDTEFGEGITLLDGKVYQLTWQSNKAYLYDAATGARQQEFRYPGEGWGLTTDGKQLYMSDGTETIYTLDPATFKRLKRTTITLRGEPLRMLNELEWIEGKIWANVYTSNQIAVIDPQTGVVEAIVDLTGLLPQADIDAQTDVLNGIAYDAAARRIFVTGKNWSKLFHIEIIEK